MTESNGAIIVFTHSRPKLLDELLESINKLEGKDETPLIVVRQLGFSSIEPIIDKWQSKISMLIELDGTADSVAKNISRNRIAGLSATFHSFEVDWAITVEDDVLLAPDTIKFTKFIYEQFNTNKNFRGINLGSRLVVSDSSINSYCKVRFGIVGQGSVMPNKTWHKILKWKILEVARETHWDSAMESYMKTGFTVVPNGSRYIDRGIKGTHMGPNTDDLYFAQIAESFIGENQNKTSNYEEKDLNYFWRNDLRKYKMKDNFMFWINFLGKSPASIKIYRTCKLIKQIKK